MRSSLWFNRRSRRLPVSLSGSAAAAACVLFAISVAGSTFVGGQGTDGQSNPRLTRTREWALRRFPQLARPTFAKLEIAGTTSGSGEGREKLKASFKAGDPVVKFRVLITNISRESVTLPLGGPHDHNRPRLLKGGVLVPYSREAERLAEIGDETGYRSVRYELLEPDRTVTDVVNLTDWYEPLPPGVYSLTVRHRFILGGDWLDTPAVSFEVTP